MIERTDFVKKQIVFVLSSYGQKISFKNDNIVVKDTEGKIKFQTTCYRVFALYVVGETSLTSGIIQRAKKFGFTIVLMTRTLKVYAVIGTRMEGNTLLRKKQYNYQSDELAQFIVKNKIQNQRSCINNIRSKNDACKDAINKLDEYVRTLKDNRFDRQSLLGIEGSAARVYFPQVFSNVRWRGRKPRIKCDYVNVTLDMGYNILFNMVDSLLQIYGFDTYCGVYHKEFYMRKSLTCDLMEPMRPIVDWQVRKAINLNQFKEEDFGIYYNKQYSLNYKQLPKYIEVFMETILEHKEEMFLFVQSYYRCFMKGKNAEEYKEFEVN